MLSPFDWIPYLLMENYSNHQVSQSNTTNTTTTTPTATRANFLCPSSNIHQQLNMNNNNNAATAAATSFHLQWGNSDHNTIYQQQQQEEDEVVKIEASGSHHHNNNNSKQFNHLQYHPATTNINMMSTRNQTVHHQQQQQRQQSGVNTHHDVEAIKAKIIAHPQYSNLLEAYMDCQKVGAPPEVMERLTVAQQELEKAKSTNLHHHHDHRSKDPDLDQFMEAYCDMLVKYKEELTRPIREAMDFMRRIESQLNMLASAPIRIFNTGDEKCEGIGSSEEDQDNSGGETDQLPEIDPRAEDRELKNHLLKKYSGYLSSLKQELSKKKKKGKLPKDARQQLLRWWEIHYKWPYPSETEKVALAEMTGLDQKQINNWFINQRKRHWKPSEDMQFMVMDGLHPQNTALYMDGHYLGDGPYRLGP